MGFWHFGRGLAGLLVGALTLSACSGGANSINSSGLEKSTLNVGVVPVPDAAPLYIAMQKGFFEQEGLRINPQVVPASPTPDVIKKMDNGSMDLAMLNYIATFKAQDEGARFKLVADISQGASKMFAVLVRKNSRIKTPKDLKGKRIAVPAIKSITHLFVTIALDMYGVKAQDFKAVGMTFTEMDTALQQGKVDAIAPNEPFITASESKGNRILLDLIDGPTDAFPVAGWGGNERFVQAHPKAIAAFQRAYVKAAKIAATNRGEVTKVIPKYTKIPAGLASVTTIDEFSVALNYPRMERVVDMLLRYGYIRNRINVRDMVVLPPKQ